MKKAEVWRTSDGEIFDEEDMAFNHERYIIIKKHMEVVLRKITYGTVMKYMQLEDRFISNYEVLKHVVEMIDHDIKKLNDEDVKEEGENEKEKNQYDRNIHEGRRGD